MEQMEKGGEGQYVRPGRPPEQTLAARGEQQALQPAGASHAGVEGAQAGMGAVKGGLPAQRAVAPGFQDGGDGGRVFEGQ